MERLQLVEVTVDDVSLDNEPEDKRLMYSTPTTGEWTPEAEGWTPKAAAIVTESIDVDSVPNGSTVAVAAVGTGDELLKVKILDAVEIKYGKQ